MVFTTFSIWQRETSEWDKRGIPKQPGDLVSVELRGDRPDDPRVSDKNRHSNSRNDVRRLED